MTEQARETENRGNPTHNESWGLLPLWAMEARSHGGSPKNSSAMCPRRVPLQSMQSWKYVFTGFCELGCTLGFLGSS